MKYIAWILAILVVGALFYVLKPMHGTSVPEVAKAEVEVVPISHASLALYWGDLVVYADPVGSAEMYANVKKPDVILVTHGHPDHFSTSTLSELMSSKTELIAPQAVADQLPDALKKNLVVLRNGDTTTFGPLTIVATPAYNLREEDKNKHPEGVGNAYVIESPGKRVYIAGDTEDTLSMRALQNIDIAFIPMNLPYTMSVEQAADAVLTFKPRHVYPYHYRTPTGFSDVGKFKELVNAGDPSIDVVQLDWYK